MIASRLTQMRTQVKYAPLMRTCFTTPTSMAYRPFTLRSPTICAAAAISAPTSATAAFTTASNNKWSTLRSATNKPMNNTTSLVLPSSSSLPQLFRRNFASSSPSPSTHESNKSPSSNSASSPASSSSSSSSSSDSSSNNDENSQSNQSWWQRWTADTPMPEKYTGAWYREWILLCVVFGVTGSCSMYVVRPLVTDLTGLQGSFKDGPWSYRLMCAAVLMPAYSVMLVTFGTLFGRHAFFKRQALKMWGRILPLHRLGITSKPPVAAAPIKPSTTSSSASVADKVSKQ